MIKIEKNQSVPEHPDLKVLSVSGDYGDNDLIECAPLSDPNFALCAFSASFIKYGGIVNQFNDPLLLGEALLQVDPESTHDAAILFMEEEARRIKREGGDLRPENPVAVDESLSQTVPEEERIEEEKEEEKEIEEEEVQVKPEETGTNDTPVAPVVPDPIQDDQTSVSTTTEAELSSFQNSQNDP